jgi:hypothetical protein
MNSKVALRRALEAGFGLETDLRDLNGSLVISHDPARLEAIELTFPDLLELYLQIGTGGVLALNVKADGLAPQIKAALEGSKIERYFVFDMSVPDTRAYLSAGMRVFTRRSEYETGSALDEAAVGLWLDAFEASHVPADLLATALDSRLSVALVSPELHHRPHLEAWHKWRDILKERQHVAERAMICTDRPDIAHQFFCS